MCVCVYTSSPHSQVEVKADKKVRFGKPQSLGTNVRTYMRRSSLLLCHSSPSTQPYIIHHETEVLSFMHKRRSKVQFYKPFLHPSSNMFLSTLFSSPLLPLYPIFSSFSFPILVDNTCDPSTLHYFFSAFFAVLFFYPITSISSCIFSSDHILFPLANICVSFFYCSVQRQHQ